MPSFSAFRVLFTMLILTIVPSKALYAADLRSHVSIDSIPEEVRSDHFRVSLNGHSTGVMHAATGYYLLNFAVTGPVSVSITAEDPHFWDAGVEVQPMRLGIRPRRHQATITFTISRPQKLSITRPGDHFADAQMLFLFANSPDSSRITESTRGVRYYSPGVHHENINAHSGDRIYLAPGAVVFGSLNFWQVHDVRVLGTGTIIYDGPQNPHSDEGWMHKPNWHCMVMDEAENIEIDGITCITRSRTWQIQMKDSHHIGFYNIKAIGGNPNDANQDGMDWLGGGDTTVRNSFFRASDDVFATQGNWDGYELDKIRVPGHDVANITIEDTIVSTSISNIIRAGWPQKTFNSGNVRMSDVDVIHMGYGGCKVPFALFELWADPDGHGTHRNFRFDNIRLEDWYSLFQLRQPAPSIRNIGFSDIWAMDGPGMVNSVSKGAVSGVNLQSATVQGFKGAEPIVRGGAGLSVLSTSGLNAHFTYTAGLLKPGQSITFTADSVTAEEVRYEWLFGDGSHEEGRELRHTFRDSEGTLLDGSGRFRVLLHVIDRHGSQAWASQSVVLSRPINQKPNRRTMTSPPLSADSNATEYLVHIPADGGYTFTLITSLDATVAIDGAAPLHTPKPRPQVCGSPGNSVQAIRFSTTLVAGDHYLHIIREPGIENADLAGGTRAGQPLLLWEGPGIERELLP